MIAFNPTTELLNMQCGNCGVWHAIPKAMHDKCLEEGGFWTCPNGHSRGYNQGKQEREKIRQERDLFQQRCAQLDDKIKQLEAANLRIRRRAAAGVCPCCNRTFQNVQRHMKQKHPNVVPLAQKVNDA